MDRRKFLENSLKAGTVLAVGSVLDNMQGFTATKNDRPIFNLIKDPKGLVDLPAGFTYKVISKEEELMSDGLTVPYRHDGMACFQRRTGELILVRNHEMGLILPQPDCQAPEFAYDKAACGGTTTIWLDKDLNVTKSYLSLSGTSTNCSGGKTPWDTWISCEESDGGWLERWMLDKPHGYNFEVNPFEPIQQAMPLRAMGKFKHEAVAIDTKTGIAYQTEDQMDSCFYRFIPNVLEKYEEGGKLQALRIKDENIVHTSKHKIEMNKEYDCDWVDIDDVDPKEDTVRYQAQKKGAAIFIRGEGMVASDDGLYFVCTMGGDERNGQIFKYMPNADGTGRLKLIYLAGNDGIIERPDNVTINKFGDLIICEDNGLDQICLIGLTQEAKVYYIASNSEAEWAGACFSPDGETLFANIQDPGMTIAINGPWETLRQA